MQECKPRFYQLFCNNDGSLSRSQAMILVVFVLAVLLLVAHVVLKVVLDIGILEECILWLLLGMGIFGLVDRVGARYISMRFGLAQLQVHDGSARGNDIGDRQG